MYRGPCIRGQSQNHLANVIGARVRTPHARVSLSFSEKSHRSQTHNGSRPTLGVSRPNHPRSGPRSLVSFIRSRRANKSAGRRWYSKFLSENRQGYHLSTV